MKRRTKDFTLGIDLGGTKILATVIDKRGRVLSRAKQRTRAEEGAKKVIRRIARSSRAAIRAAGLRKGQLGAAGVGAPGVIDPTAGIVRTAPNLPGWEDVPLAAILSEELGLPVVVHNDANAGALAEQRMGAGRRAEDLVGIFVGTGIGGGIILGGEIHAGARHAAGEIGHMVISTDRAHAANGRRCGCGRVGCVEAVASRTAVAAALKEQVAAGRDSLLAEAIGADPGERDPLRSGVIAEAYREGDPLTREVLGETQQVLGILTGSLVNLLDPAVVVFGGGLIEALGSPFLVAIRTVARGRFLMTEGKRRVRMTVADLGDDAVVLGAALAARSKL
jgi:glucokinase